jgi:methyltransferase (TIGR00027 family)
VWEVDQRENIELKRAALLRLLGSVPAQVKLVPIDFDHEDLGAVLESWGYSTSMKTFFVLEGVTQYLTRAGFDATLSFLSRVAPGSLTCRSRSSGSMTRPYLVSAMGHGPR